MDAFVQGAKERATHSVHLVHAVDLTSQVCWRSEAHGDVDTADHQDSFLGFHFPGYLGRQAPVAGVNLARFQRASKRAQHSTGGCGDNVIESRGVRFLERPRINLVMLSDGSVNAESHRL